MGRKLAVLGLALVALLAVGSTSAAAAEAPEDLQTATGTVAINLAPYGPTLGPAVGIAVSATDATGAVAVPFTRVPEQHSQAQPLVTFDLIPGCYSFELTAFAINGGSNRVVWRATNTDTRTANLCVGDGETSEIYGERVAVTGAPDRVQASVDTIDGVGIDGAQIDYFFPTDTVTFAELNALSIGDHQAVDYRGEFRSSALTNANGDLLYVGTFGPPETNCFVASAIAPTGYRFVETKTPFLRRTSCVNESFVYLVEPATRRDVATISGTILTASGDVVPGSSALLFGIDDKQDWTYIDTISVEGSSYSREVEPGCYGLVLLAPFGWNFSANSFFATFESVCVGPDQPANLTDTIQPW